MRTVLLSIQALLSAPNPDDPLANDVAQLWKENESQAIKTGEFTCLIKTDVSSLHSIECLRGPANACPQHFCHKENSPQEFLH